MFNYNQYSHLCWRADEFCCGDYVALVLKDQLGIEMSPFHYSGGIKEAYKKIKDTPYRSWFTRSDTPQEWSVVEMRMFKDSDHVGVYVVVDGKGYITHCERGSGILLSTLEEIKESYQIMGYWNYESSNV